MPYFSKVFELVVCKQLTTFLLEEDILSSAQHGFIKGKSTATAVYNFIKIILESLEETNSVIALLLDLSKAFDTLSHQYVLRKLEAYGIREVELEWFRSYLSSRTQRVNLSKDGNKVESKPIEIELGIPQGSILGPIIFILFINDLHNEYDCQPEVDVINYADDTDVIVKGNTYQEAVKLAECSLKRAEDWFCSNKLCMNTNKTTAILFKTPQSRFDTPQNMNLGHLTLDFTKHSNLLGLQIDDTLNWSEHITVLCGKLSNICYSLGVLSEYLSLGSMKTIYHAVFESKLRYGIMFYGSSAQIERVLCLQKRALRKMLKIYSRESCRGRFNEFGVLTAPAIYIQECLIFVHKNKHLFETKTCGPYDTRTTQLKYPRHRLTITEKGPEYRCVRFYNSLPAQLRTIPDLKNFKKSIYKILLDIEPYCIEEFLEYVSK